MLTPRSEYCMLHQVYYPAYGHCFDCRKATQRRIGMGNSNYCRQHDRWYLEDGTCPSCRRAVIDRLTFTARPENWVPKFEETDTIRLAGLGVLV